MKRMLITDAGEVSRLYGWAPRRTMQDIDIDTVRWLAGNEDLLRPIFG